MTREEAIADIKHSVNWAKENDERWCDSIEVGSLELAIEALEKPEPKKGKWNITDAYPHNVYCSECHIRYAQTHWSVWEDGSLPRNYCPNCGAYMETDK